MADAGRVREPALDVRVDGNLGAYSVKWKSGDLQAPASLLPVADIARGHLRQMLQIGLHRHAAREHDAFRNDFSLTKLTQSIVNLDRAGFKDVPHGLQNLFARHADRVGITERRLGFRPVELYLRARV